MRQRICIGIQELDEGWKSVLNQIGVSYEKIDYNLKLSQYYSVLILNTFPDSQEISQLHEYMKHGGALIEMKGVHPFLHKHHFSKQQAKTLFKNTSNGDFEHVPFLDIYDEAELHKESKLYRGIIHFQVWKRGIIGFFGVDFSKLIQKTGYSRKRFYSESGYWPDEIVSRISRHSLVEAFTVMLRQLHFRRSLPFVQKWSSPSEKPVFGFRIDTDFGDQDSIRNLYQTLNQHRIKGSWFLHVQAHEEWLDVFKDFQNQEIALHGYDHGTSKAVSKTRANIQAGLSILQQQNFAIYGFCAPYGIWNKALEHALPDFDFEYTSEFTFCHDGFPLEVGASYPMQIPVHPICTGSLSRKHYDEASMAAYFAQIMQKKLGRFEPVFFYHHPLQPGLQAWNHIFELVNQQGLTKLTFLEFSDFWKKRNQTRFQAFVNDQKLSIESEASSLLFQIASSHDGFSLTKANDDFDVQKSNDFQYSNHYLPDEKEARKLRKTDFGLLKTSFLDWKNRIRL